MSMRLRRAGNPPVHPRSTFRRISQDTAKFVSFANGLMNESNALVASVMEKLPEVRAVQLQMRDPAQWGAMTEAQRNEVSERLARSCCIIFFLFLFYQ